MRIPDPCHRVTVLVAAATVVLFLAGCVAADPPEPRAATGTSGPVDASGADTSGETGAGGSPKLSGGGWAAQADVACTEVAASTTSPAGDAGSGTDLLSRHQNVAYLLASRLSAIPGPDPDGQQLVAALHEIGSSTEELITALGTKPVDEQARQKADAARTAAIGKAASLTAKLGLRACTPLVAGS